MSTISAGFFELQLLRRVEALQGFLEKMFSVIKTMMTSAAPRSWQHSGLLCVLLAIIPLVSSSEPLPSPCPLDFSLLDLAKSVQEDVKNSHNVTYHCTSFIQALLFVMVEYVAKSGFFLVPSFSAEACWDAFDHKLSLLGHPTSVRSECSFPTSFLAQQAESCRNITSIQALEDVVPKMVLSDISNTCTNASTEQLPSCSMCSTAVVNAATKYLYPGAVNGSINNCQDILDLYAASSMPNTTARLDVASCLLNIVLTSHNDPYSVPPHSNYVFASVGAAVTLLVSMGLIVFLYVRHLMRKLAQEKLELESSRGKLANSSNLTWYTLDELKAATNNFSIGNVLGTGGFGNVYKGTLKDGTHIAVKRFKNCSPAGDQEFFHEVKVISSVKHRNLVAIRGCCLDKSSQAGHQRIIVYDYMPNGSLHDHLFNQKTCLDWPKRHNIAVGVVRGLAYLHQEVQPAIIHRDIKASNILLDANWNARVADFGLAKFTPDGATHVTTRVAGTHGYVAPEYVLYGKLNEKSDVYSFGVLLLELLTGRKIITFESEGPCFITDWVWSLVKKGRLSDVLDPKMENLGPLPLVEKFVHIALLCAHPHVPYRPFIDQVLKLMETGQPVPSLRDRPIPYTSVMVDIEKAAGSPGALSSSSGFRSYSSYSDLAR